jgi:hypothetical protein
MVFTTAFLLMCLGSVVFSVVLMGFAPSYP